MILIARKGLGAVLEAFSTMVRGSLAARIDQLDSQW